MSKCNVSMKTLLNEDLSDPVYHGKFSKIVDKTDFRYKKIVSCYKKIGYNMDCLQETACADVYIIIVDNYASLFICTTAGRSPD